MLWFLADRVIRPQLSANLGDLSRVFVAGNLVNLFLPKAFDMSHSVLVKNFPRPNNLLRIRDFTYSKGIGFAEEGSKLKLLRAREK